jgi:hypothetical protein
MTRFMALSDASLLRLKRAGGSLAERPSAHPVDLSTRGPRRGCRGEIVRRPRRFSRVPECSRFAIYPLDSVNGTGFNKGSRQGQNVA